MKEYFPVLKSVSLFSGIDIGGLEPMLGCIGAKVKKVRKGAIVLLAGDKPRHVGIVLSGQLQIIREDYEGNRSILSVLTSGDTFAEALCCAGVAESPVTVLADSEGAIMLLSIERILHTCPQSCSFHRAMIKNLLGIVARKSLMLQNHMEILSLNSIRAKVIRYIESLAPKHGHEVVIPLNREEMADHLCVDRSALSHELSKMKKDGLIDYRKNRFLLK